LKLKEGDAAPAPAADRDALAEVSSQYFLRGALKESSLLAAQLQGLAAVLGYIVLLGSK